MYIKKVELNHFRNYEKQEISLENGINIFYGDNAQGKTNIIESIFLCAMGRSFRTNKEKELIQFGEQQSSIEVQYEKVDREGKIRVFLDDHKKIFLNEIKIKRISEMIGKINVVLFNPDDIEIMKSGPAVRRKFLDMMISQLKPKYLYLLNQYLKVLEQRNHYLRQIKYENKSKEMLSIWDDKLAEYGFLIYQYRKEYINKILEKINDIHQKITEEKETIGIQYLSKWQSKEEYQFALENNRKIDMIKGYTTVGIHRDDFAVFINENKVNIYGSQGQNRTVTLSLKMTELEIIKEEIEDYPILLLDDFMSELDEKRRKNFLKNIENTQVVITCTEKIDLGIDQKEYMLYNVEQGKIKNA